MSARRSTIKQGAINFSTSGDNTVVTNTTTGPLNIYGWRFIVSGATTLVMKDVNASSITIFASGPMQMLGAGSSDEAAIGDEPWFQCQPGDNFIINSSAAVTVGGLVYYTIG